MDLQTQLRVRASVWYNKEHGGNHGPVFVRMLVGDLALASLLVALELTYK